MNGNSKKMIKETRLQNVRVLIVGGSGFLGSKLKDSIKGRDNYSTFYKNKPISNKCNLNKNIRMDIRRKSEIIYAIETANPSAIIHCGGMTDTDLCEKEKQLAWDINVKGVENLMSVYQGKIIYFSTDYVFDGRNPPYSEESKPNPLNYYGMTKLEAEKKILEKEENLVVRVSGLYGISHSNNKFIDKLVNNAKVFAYTNLISSPTYIDDVVRNMSVLIKSSGIIHLSSYEGISRYNFLRMVVEFLGLPTLVLPREYKTNTAIAKRPYNSTMISLKGVETTPLKVAVKEMAERLKWNA